MVCATQSRPPVKTYIVCCRGAFDQDVITKLEVLDVFWTQAVSPNNLPTKRVCMLIEATTEGQAIQKAHTAVHSSGGLGTDYTCPGEFSEAEERF